MGDIIRLADIKKSQPPSNAEIKLSTDGYFDLSSGRIWSYVKAQPDFESLTVRERWLVFAEACDGLAEECLKKADSSNG